jgi:hypothetical protein
MGEAETEFEGPFYNSQWSEDRQVRGWEVGAATSEVVVRTTPEGIKIEMPH